MASPDWVLCSFAVQGAKYILYGLVTMCSFAVQAAKYILYGLVTW
jgi:hypothetical protein